jgi:photosystem II stability/assembly factor-like uncharacterized protein
MSFNSEVLTTARTDFAVYLGGNFTSYREKPANRIIYLTKAGEIEKNFQTGSGFDNTVKKIWLQEDEKILVGGAFTSYNGQPKNRIVRLNTNGSIDETFNIGSGFNGDVEFICQQPNGRILVGGAFTSYNGQPKNGIVRLNTNGSIDETFNIGSGFNGTVFNIHIINSDNRIIVGGSFTSYNNQSRNRIIILNIDGTIDNNFNIGSGFNGDIFAIYYLNNNIFIGGDFTDYNGFPANRIISLQNNGLRKIDFQSGSGFNNTVYEIKPAINSNTEILIGGKFDKYNEISCNGLIQIDLLGNISFESECLIPPDLTNRICYKEQALPEDLLNQDFSFFQQPIFPGKRLYTPINPNIGKIRLMNETFAKYFLGSMVVIGNPRSNKVEIYEIQAENITVYLLNFDLWVKRTKYNFIKIQTIDGPPSIDGMRSYFGITIAGYGLNYLAIAGAYYDINTNEPKSIYIKTFAGDSPDKNLIEILNTLSYDLPPNLTYAGISLDLFGNYLLVGLPNLNKVILYTSKSTSSPAWEIYNTYISPYLYENIEFNEDTDSYIKNMLYGWSVSFFSRSGGGLPILMAGICIPLFQRCPCFDNQGKFHPVPKFGSSLLDQESGESLSSLSPSELPDNPEWPFFPNIVNITITDPYYNEKRGMVQSLHSLLYRIDVEDGIFKYVLGKNGGVYDPNGRWALFGPAVSNEFCVVRDPVNENVCVFCTEPRLTALVDLEETCFSASLPVNLPTYFKPTRTVKDENKGSLIISPKGDFIIAARDYIYYYWKGSQKIKVTEVIPPSNIPIKVFDKRIWRDIALTTPIGLDNLSEWLAFSYAFGNNSVINLSYDRFNPESLYRIDTFLFNDSKWNGLFLRNIDPTLDTSYDIEGIDDRHAALAATENWKNVAPEFNDFTDKSAGYKTVLENNGNILIYNGNNLININIIKKWVSVAMSQDGKYQTALAWDDISEVGEIYISNNYGLNWTQTYQGVKEWKKVDLNSSGQFQTAIAKNSKIFISSDYGLTWSEVFSEGDWTGISINGRGNIQLACTLDNVYESKDYGISWSNDPSFDKASSQTNLIATAVNKNKEKYNNIIGIITNSNNGIYSIDTVSKTNFQTSLQQVNLLPISPSSSPGQICRIAASDDAVFQTIVVENGKILISKNYGATWEEIQDPIGSVNKNWKNIAISETGKYQIAVASNDNIYISNNFGVSWQATASVANWTSVKTINNGLYIIALVNGGRVHVSTNFGANWTIITHPLLASNKNWKDLAISKNAKYQTLLASNDNIYISRNFGNNWELINISKNWVSIDMSSDGQFQTALVSNGEVAISRDYGNTWSFKTFDSNQVWSKISMSSTGEIQIIISPNSVMVSFDYGATWGSLNTFYSNYSSVFISKTNFNALKFGASNVEGSYDINTGWRPNQQYGYKIENINYRRDEDYRAVGCLGDEIGGDLGMIVLEKFSNDNNTWKRHREDTYGAALGDKIGKSFSLPAISFNNSENPIIQYTQGYIDLFFNATNCTPETESFIIANNNSDILSYNGGKNILASLDSGNLRIYADECIDLDEHVYGCCVWDGGTSCWCCGNKCYTRDFIRTFYTTKVECNKLSEDSAIRIFDKTIYPGECVPCPDPFNFACFRDSWDVKDGSCEENLEDPEESSEESLNQSLSSISQNQNEELLYKAPMDKISLDKDNNILSGIYNLINNEINSNIKIY